MIKPRYLTFFQLGLECDETFKVIGRTVLKDLTTLSKKIKLSRQGLRISPCLLHFLLLLLRDLFVNLFQRVFDRYTC